MDDDQEVYRLLPPASIVDVSGLGDQCRDANRSQDDDEPIDDERHGAMPPAVKNAIFIDFNLS